MSHFSKIKTKIYNLDILKKSLSDLDITYVNQAKEIRGYQGSTHKVDLIILGQDKYDVGFKWNGTEYELVTDLMFWSQSTSVESFLNTIHQRYAYNTIMKVTENDGFNFTQSETGEDGAIRLLLTRHS
jgi:hypothetical protein